MVSGAGLRGGQQRLIPKPGHPYWHFILTHSAVTTEPGSMTFAPSTPISIALSQKDSMGFTETSFFFSWSSTGKARGTSIEIPPYACLREGRPRLRRVIHR